MAHLPQDPTWWRHVSSAADFCHKAGFGPSTTAFVLSVLGSDTSETRIKDCADLSIQPLFSRIDTPRSLRTIRLQDPDKFIRVWCVLRAQYDEPLLPISLQRNAYDLAQSLCDPPAVLNQDAWQYRTSEAAFRRVEKADARGGHASLAVLSTLLNQHAQYSASGNYLAPYSTIVGPSGIGKSFAVRQMAVRHGVYVAYSNLSPLNSRGFPRPVTVGKTPIGDTHIAAEDLWETYLANQVKLANCCKDVGITATGLFELLTSSKDEISLLRKKLQDGFHTAPVEPAVIQTLLVPIKATLEDMGLNSAPITQAAPHSDGSHPVIICFDEARALLQHGDFAFRSLRRAARSAATAMNSEKAADTHQSTVPFFIVLLDTTSRISNFTPPGQYDASAKELRLEIFHPIYQIDTFNLFTPPAATLEEPAGADRAMEQLFAHGRPLWGAFLEAGSHWPGLLKLAVAKLSAQTEPLAYDLSLLTCRMNFYICSPVLAEAMVAASMRYVISISHSRDSLVTTQPSEPVLALAASCLLQDPSVRRSCIRSWIRGLHSGAVNPGDIGEQVASLVLLFASDYASEPSRALPPHNALIQNAVAPKAIPLGRFVAALLGEDAWQSVQSLDHGSATRRILSTGLVFFNHIVRLSAAPTLALLEATYKRGAALFLPGNFPGMDMAIPVRVPDGRMALLLIQVKNRQDDSLTPGLGLYMEEALHRAEKALGLSDESHGIYGIVGLAMCLRTSSRPHFAAAATPTARPTTRRTRSDDGAGLLGIAFGLDTSVYPCMKAPCAAAIKTVDGQERGPAELGDVCQLLTQLLEQWPHAYADEDAQTRYAQKLLDPASELHGAA